MATLVVTLDGAEYRIDSGSLTGIDARDFRAKVGTGLVEVFYRGATDLDTVAGLVWLVRRKTDPALAYESVALALNYDSDLDINAGNGAAPTPDDDPETSAGS